MISTHQAALRAATKALRAPMGAVMPEIDSTHLYFETTILPRGPGHARRTNYRMPFLILVTNPCRHVLACGGCTMCGYSNLSSFRGGLSGDSVYTQFRRGLRLIEAVPHREMVAVGTAGSFLDPDEVPCDVQWRIVHDLSACQGLYYINLEARAEYITAYALENIASACDSVERLSIGIGLESSSELIRKLCVQKGMTTQSFLCAVDVLRQHNISPTVYVTLGKPFLNTWANIRDAVDSINFAFEHGADRVVLIRIGVQPHSLVEWLCRRGLYKPMEPWATAEVLRVLSPNRRDDVLLADPRLPRPLRARQCDCAETASELLDQYKGSHDWSYFEAIDMLTCAHKVEWLNRVETERASAHSVEEQIEEAYALWLPLWKNEFGGILSA